VGKSFVFKFMMVSLLRIFIYCVDVKQTRRCRLIDRFGHGVGKMSSDGVELVAGLVVMGFGFDEAFLVHVCRRCAKICLSVTIGKPHEMGSLGSGLHFTVNDMVAYCQS
jgi:hypothetical protein